MRRNLGPKLSPVGGKKGCLCKDGKSYNSKCCDGSLEAQGIGNLDGGSIGNTINANTTRVLNS